MTDLLLQAWTAALIERTKLEWMLGRGKAWKPGERLKLLFAGYNGNRNTGSDVRVEEMLRQVRQVLGADRLQLTVTALDFALTRGYFGDAAQVRLPDLFPPFLYKEVRQHHGVIACEGSMFKSKFANALTTMFIGALGMAAGENKLSIGYGAEAGYMDPSLARLCARYCRHSVVVTRNAESQAVLSSLGVESELGTDTAWTFESHPVEYGRKVLTDAGWDGAAPVLIFCPINPFFWPVKASVLKWVARGTTGGYKESHYRGPYFHKSGAQVDASYEQYLKAFAKAAQAARQKYRMFPVLVACETAGCARLPCNRRTHRWRAGVHFRRLRHVSIGEHSAVGPSDDLVALSRNRHVHAGARAVSGSDDGRTHSQPDARTRPQSSAFYCR